MARINPTLFGRAPKNCNSREKKAHPRVLPRPSLLLSVRTGAFTSEMEVPHSPHWSPLKDLPRISDAGATEDECTVHASVELKSTETEIKSHRCPICYQTMLMPKRAPNILMPCGHTFCNACLNARDDPRCRTCGDRWRHRVPNHQLQTTIQAYVDATATAAASFEDSVIWTSGDRGALVASSSFDAALARAHVRCEQLRERMREGEVAQTAALERRFR